jgi:HSP20 family protein
MIKDTKKELNIGGKLNILGFELDLEELLNSPEGLVGRLEDLREKLKKAGGKELLSDEEWKQGGASITGHIRTSGLLGDREFHIGTMGGHTRKEGKRACRETSTPEIPEIIEPPVDVFDEGEEITIIADVPGVNMDELELKLDGDKLTISTTEKAKRNYQKEIRLEHPLDIDSMESNCRNGVLEIRIRKSEVG